MAEHPNRRTVDLAGQWEYSPVARTTLREDGSISEDRTELPAAGRTAVPSNWHRAGLAGFHGRVAFRRDLPEVDGDGWWLCFEGVDYFASVRIDGREVCRHEGAFDGFEVRLPAGARELEVEVDAPSEERGTLWPYRKRQLKGIFTQWEPLDPFQSSTGGIWGGVRLEQRPALFCAAQALTTFLVPRPAVEEGAYVETRVTDARVLLEIEAHADDAATEVPLSLTVCGVSAECLLVLPAGRSRHRLALTVREPQLWWPWDRGQPVLHEATVRLGGDDELRTRVGIREVDYEEATGTFLVNGERVAVRGSNVIPEKWLSLYDPDRVAGDIALARNAGLNAVRVCVHVTTDAFYEACDEAGLLVWQDMPLQWDYQIDDTVIVEAADQCERIVRRLHDHPCIALWSAHNEPFPADRRNFAGPLLRAIRAGDPTRPVHPASDFTEHAYHGWFLGDIRDYAGPTAAAVMSEFGAQALPSADEVRALGATGWPPAGPKWGWAMHEPTPVLDVAQIPLGDSLEEHVAASQRHQARALQRGIESYRSRGISYFQFALMDGWPQVSWSVVSYDRVPKLGYAALTAASQPVLIGADLSREVLSDAWDAHRWPPLLGVWVVNDTRQALPGARWEAHLGGQVVGSGEIDVAADAVTRWSPDFQRWPQWQQPDLTPGEHRLELVLKDAAGVVRSRNGYPMTMVQHGLDLPPPD